MRQMAASGPGARALVCAGMRCSLPVADADGLRETVAEMLALERSRGVTGRA